MAPPAHRARYYARRFHVSESDAQLHNTKCDAACRRYVAAHFSAAIKNPAAHDLVIKTAQVPLEEAVEMVAAPVYAQAKAGA